LSRLVEGGGPGPCLYRRYRRSNTDRRLLRHRCHPARSRFARHHALPGPGRSHASMKIPNPRSFVINQRPTPIARHTMIYTAARSNKLSWLRSPDLNLRSLAIAPRTEKIADFESYAGACATRAIDFRSKQRSRSPCASRRVFCAQSVRAVLHALLRPVHPTQARCRQECDKPSDYFPSRASVALPGGCEGRGRVAKGPDELFCRFPNRFVIVNDRNHCILCQVRRPH
jgi:hypothetical protein